MAGQLLPGHTYVRAPLPRQVHHVTAQLKPPGIHAVLETFVQSCGNASSQPLAAKGPDRLTVQNPAERFAEDFGYIAFTDVKAVCKFAEDLNFETSS